MGYTHHWEINSKEENKEIDEKNYQKAIKDCNKVIKAYYKEHKGTDNSLSGYSAHCPIGQYGGIGFNGKGDNSYETFYFRHTLIGNNQFNFCKTNQKPYNIVVVACLSIMKFYLKDCIEVTSDGDFKNWIDGVNLANKVLKRKKVLIESPIKAPSKLVGLFSSFNVDTLQ